MRYMIRVSYIDVLGVIWMPAVQAGTRIRLDGYDVENMRDEDGKVTRESVDRWVNCHAGDFQSVTDFCASIEDGDETLDFGWTDEDAEMTFSDLMNPDED